MRPRVLLVDDNEEVLMRTADVLNTSCTIVGTEIEGRAAIDAAATLQPDVIVLDISMPGIDGFEVAASPSGGWLEGGTDLPHGQPSRRARRGCARRRHPRLRGQAASFHRP